MGDSEFYDPQLLLVDMREREGLRGMAAFRRRAQDLCNRGYKPLERNDAKTGAGRKKKTRKKRGGNEIGDVCPICVEEMSDEKKVINVHVGNRTIVPHYFHKECINSWKKYDRQAECPSCRKIMEYRLDDNLWPMGAAYTQARTGEFMKCAECGNVLTEEEEVRVRSGEAPPICPECLQLQQTGGKRRKKKTRNKRGGWRRRDTDFNKDDIGYYYDCWNRDGNYDDVKYREGMTITGKWDVLRPISEWDIIEMQDSHRYDPNLILYDESRPNFGEFRIPAQQLCTRGFKPLKRNDAKTGAGRKKKTGKKKKTIRRR